MLIFRKGVLVFAFCLLHILKRWQHERCAAFSNAPRYLILPIAQEGTHGRTPVGTHGKVDVEQQHVRGAGEQAREIAPGIEGAWKGGENEVDVCACDEARRVGYQRVEGEKTVV